MYMLSSETPSSHFTVHTPSSCTARAGSTESAWDRQHALSKRMTCCFLLAIAADARRRRRAGYGEGNAKQHLNQTPSHVPSTASISVISPAPRGLKPRLISCRVNRHEAAALGHASHGRASVTGSVSTAVLVGTAIHAGTGLGAGPHHQQADPRLHAGADQEGRHPAAGPRVRGWQMPLGRLLYNVVVSCIQPP